MDFKTREDAVQWLCLIHNVVNSRKKEERELFNCDDIWNIYTKS